ncbi:hypothetical protein [Demequina capsici]|uniref:AbiEi antitoxin C-terminal domain-containing protein n=1 Tax=Demequina capsici TaxID=3075620 RepID=A0AA96JEI9_9MICO|nr:hypothetical protein [Demequina sp. OYTSA14]WNM25754.1 hypothetical protein RN606_06290 [Demequina sp. OYTSA14]
MLLVHSTEIGAASYGRALREGTLVALTRSIATPLDIPLSPGLRALALADQVPDAAVVTGLAGLWIMGAAALPLDIDVLRRTGSPHVARSSTAIERVRIHAGNPGTLPPHRVGTLLVASAPRCVADALRWSSLGTAITASWNALCAALVDDGTVRAELEHTPRDRTRRRADNAWAAVEEAFGQRAGHDSLLRAA